MYLFILIFTMRGDMDIFCTNKLWF